MKTLVLRRHKQQRARPCATVVLCMLRAYYLLLCLLLSTWSFVLIIVYYMPMGLCEKYCKQQSTGTPLWSSDRTKIVVLDIDGTLISSSTVKTVGSVPLDIAGTVLHLKMRPFLQEFLAFLVSHFELGIYTAAKQEYADRVVALIGLEKHIPKQRRLYRNSCIQGVKGVYLKDLMMIEDNLSRVIIIDDTIEGLLQVENAIVVTRWAYGEDTELLSCIEVLKRVRNCADVRKRSLDLRD